MDKFRNQPIPNSMRRDNVLQPQPTFTPGNANTAAFSTPSERWIVRSSMPMPSSGDAPRFTGKNLKEFLSDYEIGTEEAGWDERHRCTKLPLYCKRPMRDLISTFEEVASGQGWESLKKKLADHYHPDIYKPRYSRRDVEKYSRKKRVITKRKQFAQYYRDFMMRVKFVKPRPLVKEEVNQLFWEGLPHNLQRDIYLELRAQYPKMDRTVAQDVEVIRQIAMSTLDSSSVYSHITNSQSQASDYENDDPENTKVSRKSSRSPKAKTAKEPTKDIYHDLRDESDSDTSSSEDESESDYFDDSDDEMDTDNEEISYKSSRRRKSPKKSSKTKDQNKKKTFSEKDVIRRAAVDTTPKDSRIEQLAEEIKRLTLQLDVNRPRDQMKRTNSFSKPNDQVGMLMEEMRNLRRQIVTNNENSRPPPRQPLYEPNRNTSPWYCWFCKQTDTHPIGIRHCPSCQQMVKDGYLLDNGYRISMPDGSRLPRLNSNENMEQYLRKTQAPQREATPSQGRASSAMLIEPHPSVYDRQSANGNWSTMEADRSEKRNVRFDPIAKPEPRTSCSPSQGQPYIDVPPRPRSGLGPPKIVAPTPPKKQDENLPKPRPAMNPPVILKRPDPRGPLVPPARMNNIPEDDIEMIDPSSDRQKKPDKTYIPRTPPKMQFTTDLRQKVNIHKVMDQIYEQEVRLPLGVILGISGEVSKEFNSATRTHKDYVSKAPDQPKETRSVRAYEETYESDYEYDSDDESDYEEIDRTTNHSELTHMASVGELKHILERNLYAMGTGKLSIKINDTENISAMVDTGSELNLISRRLQEQLGLPLDPAGSYWGIKGVNGGPETLHGCCRRIPIEIGGLRFDHIFFVKNGPIGHDYDLLMGQPWLRAAAAEISYGNERPDSMRLRIYEQGDTSGNSLVINLNVDHKREATKLIQAAKFTMVPEAIEDNDLDPNITQTTRDINNIKLGDQYADNKPRQEDYRTVNDDFLLIEPQDAQIDDDDCYTISTISSSNERDEMDIDDLLIDFEAMVLDEPPKKRRKRFRDSISKELYQQALLEKAQRESIAYRVHARRQIQKQRKKLEEPRASNQLTLISNTSEILPEINEPLHLPTLGPDIDMSESEYNYRIDDEMWREFERLGAEPSINAENHDEPSIPSLGRKLSEAL